MERIPRFLRTRYDRVEPMLGGAEARVYRCTRNGITTAVKIFNTQDTESQQRFVREVDILTRMRHENVVSVLKAGEADGACWYEMEYASQGHFGVMHGYLFFSDYDRVHCFRQICSGLQALHESSPPIVHGDLKPSNILVFQNPGAEPNVILKIADFGQAAVAGSRRTTDTGTAGYMAPEGNGTRLSDLYSLGIVFLEACTGDNRPSRENLDRVPELLRPIVERLLQQRSVDRFQSAEEVLGALNSFSPARLMFGREVRENEVAEVWQANAGREVENAFAALLEPSPDEALDRLAVFERKLDGLGDGYDDVADWLMRVPGSVIAAVERADRDAGGAGEPGLRLVQRFLNAARVTTEIDHYTPRPDNWSRFLADTFVSSSYRATKNLCLEGLVTLLARFGSPGTKRYLHWVIINVDDPFDMAEIARLLRHVGREDVALLLDGVPDERSLDHDAIQTALLGND
jgi:serine/threonine protein kinase